METPRRIYRSLPNQKNESWIWKLEFKIQINQSASSLYLSLYLLVFASPSFNFGCMMTSHFVAYELWFDFFLHSTFIESLWIDSRKKQSFSVQITTRNRLQWISIASELYQIIIKKRETQKINNKYGFRCKKNEASKWHRMYTENSFQDIYQNFIYFPLVAYDFKENEIKCIFDTCKWHIQLQHSKGKTASNHQPPPPPNGWNNW